MKAFDIFLIWMFFMILFIGITESVNVNTKLLKEIQGQLNTIQLQTATRQCDCKIKNIETNIKLQPKLYKEKKGE